jgi:hypothetical protein
LSVKRELWRRIQFYQVFLQTDRPYELRLKSQYHYITRPKMSGLPKPLVGYRRRRYENRRTFRPGPILLKT